MSWAGPSPMVNVICLCTSYVLILGCDASWEACHSYFLYILCYSVVVILIELPSQNRINILLFELFFTCIETHIFVPSISISHIFISIIKFFCRFSILLGQMFTLNILHPNTCIQHNTYTIFEQIFCFHVSSLATCVSNA